MLSDDKLTGWLVALFWQYQQAGGANLPTAVLDDLVTRGWMEKPEAPNWDGKQPCDITAAGHAVYDLNAPEWGIDTIPEESEK